MPPKRVKTIDQDDNTSNKKQKTDSSLTTSNPSITISSPSNDDRQVCWYDGNCKQKNPSHWSTYKYLLFLLILFLKYPRSKFSVLLFFSHLVSKHCQHVFSNPHYLFIYYYYLICLFTLLRHLKQTVPIKVAADEKKPAPTKTDIGMFFVILLLFFEL